MVYIKKKKKKNNTITIVEQKSANEVPEWSIVQELLKEMKKAMSNQKVLSLNDDIVSQIKGDKGMQGETGITGDIGADGLKGDKGDKGAKGDTGKPGYTPIKGQDYGDGKDGERGDDGEDGEDGKVGKIPKHQYKLGSLRFENPDGTWGKWIDLLQLAGSSSGKTLHRGGISNMIHESFAGDDATTTFTLSNLVTGNSTAAFVRLQGQALAQTTHWTVSGTTLTLTFAPATGETVDISYFV